MRSFKVNSALIRSGLTASVLLLGSAAAFGQVTVNLTAAPGTATMPDGSAVPMWGYTCGTVNANCRPLLQPAPASGAWSPVIITVPTGQDLTITLTNNLTFQPPTPTGGPTPPPNNIPTSIVIVGQLGGGLGANATSDPSPDHSNAQSQSWFTAGTLPGQAPVGVGTPPVQGSRVRSMATEVAAGLGSTTANTTSLCWGVCLTNGVAAGPALRPGTYLIESGTHPSIQGAMGLYGILVVTTAPTSGTAAGTAYPVNGTNTGPVTYNADVPLLLSEIDPVQNAAVYAAVTTAGFSETTVWSGQQYSKDASGTSGVFSSGCGAQFNADGSPNPSWNTCYPPAVNYTPLFYMINGVAFDKTHSTNSLFNATAGTATSGITGTVLVRLVNAGLRMHVPSIVGAQTGTATPGFSLIAEDGNVSPGTPRVQSEVFMPAGKTMDVMINAANTPASATALPIFDRELSLSGNSISRDNGMLAYISINGAGAPAVAVVAAAAVADNNYFLVPGHNLVVSDPGKGVLANDVNILGAHLSTRSATPACVPPANGQSAVTGPCVMLNTDGTFTFVPSAAQTSATFAYCGNGATTGTTGLCALVTLNAATLEAGSAITLRNSIFSSNATFLKVNPPGVLAYDADPAGYPLTVQAGSVVAQSGLTVSVDQHGGFTASVTAGGTYTFAYRAQNSQGTASGATACTTTGTAVAGCARVTLNFAAASNLAVTVYDGNNKSTQITDYRWMIEEDRTFYVDPTKTTTGSTSATGTAVDCSRPTANPAQCQVPLTFGVNFHTSHMPVVATGCTGPISCEGGQTIIDTTPGSATYGQHINAVCNIGNGICQPDTTTNPNLTSGVGAGGQVRSPATVHLDPTKRYYLTIFPGDAGNPAVSGNTSAPVNCNLGSYDPSDPTGLNTACGHGMGGAPIAAGQTAVTVYTQPSPYPTAKLSVFVFEDDFPLNGEQDGGGGIDVLSPNEPGLGNFNITIFDDAGGTGDATGQVTYDMFNQPLSNALAGQIDPITHLDACPISTISRIGVDPNSTIGASDPTQTGLAGVVTVCPKHESDGKTLSPLAGQAVIANLFQGRYGVVATPGADRIARGEEWLQTNTLDGQKAHDSFMRIGEPSFFQEFGPAGYHVSIGFANPSIINSRKAGVCNGTDPNITGPNCSNSVTAVVSTERMSRTPDERLYA